MFQLQKCFARPFAVVLARLRPLSVYNCSFCKLTFIRLGPNVKRPRYNAQVDLSKIVSIPTHSLNVLLHHYNVSSESVHIGIYSVAGDSHHTNLLSSLVQKDILFKMTTERRPASHMPSTSVARRNEDDRDDDLLRLTSNFSEDQTEEPLSLARPLSRRERFFKLGSAITWSADTFGDGPSSARSVQDQTFQNGILEGLNRRLAARSTQVLKDRVKGTMKTKREDAQLPQSVEEIRPRHEHIQRRVVQMPVLLADDDGFTVPGQSLFIVRNAMFAELRDLYRIVSSMDARKFDVSAADVRAMYEWYATFENFLRLYLMASEKEIYGACDIDDWASLQGALSKDMRKREKKRIIEMADRVQIMKRTMIAADKLCGKHVPELHQRVDDFTMRVVRFLNEEVKQLPNVLANRYSPQAVDDMFRSVVKEMRSNVNGREMVILMSRGIGTSTAEMINWIRKVCGATARVSVATWLRKLVDLHMNYATIFEKAENEYIAIYEELSVQVDDEVAGVRRNSRRRKRV